MKVILASQSKRRQQLLSWLLVDFKIKPSKIDEAKFAPLARTPEELVIKLAITKAKDVSEKKNEDSVIVAADTVVVTDDLSEILDCGQIMGGRWQIIGKPQNKTQIRQTLEFLNAKTHQVYTGLCVLSSQSNHYGSDFVVTKVIFKKLSQSFLNKYSKKDFLLDHAGSYSIQVMGDELVEDIEGSYTSVVGLPMAKTAQFLQQFGVELKPDWPKKVLEETGYED